MSSDIPQSTIVFKCERNQKAKWVKAAQKSKGKLVDWLIEAAEEKILRDNSELVLNKAN